MVYKGTHRVAPSTPSIPQAPLPHRHMAADLRWFTPSGTDMNAEDWAEPNARSVGLFIDGSTDPDDRSRRHTDVDDDFLVLKRVVGPLTFTVPAICARLEHPCDTPTRRSIHPPLVAVGNGGAALIRGLAIVGTRA